LGTVKVVFIDTQPAKYFLGINTYLFNRLVESAHFDLCAKPLPGKHQVHGPDRQGGMKKRDGIPLL